MSATGWKRVAECVYQRGDSFMVRVRADGKPRIIGTYPSKRAAIAARDKAKNDAREGRQVADARGRRTTVDAIAEGWLANLDPTLAPNTRRAYQRWWRSTGEHVLACGTTIGQTRLVALTVTDVKDWIGAQLAAGFSASTVSSRLYVLRLVLDRAIDSGEPIGNVAKRAKLPRGSYARDTWVAADEHAVGAAMGELRDRYRIMALLCVGLGLRSGEARGLTVDRIHRDADGRGGTIVVDRQLLRLREGETWGATPHYGHHGLTLPKGGKVRTIHASAGVLQAIADHVERYGVGPLGVVCSGSTGAPLLDTTWQNAWRRAKARAGVGGLRTHDLRHSYASWALARGVDITHVQADLGHTMVTTTHRYQHRADERTAAASDVALGRLSAAAARKPRAHGHLRAV